MANRCSRVLIVDDQALFRAALRSILLDLPGVEVVAEAADGREALAMVEAHQPEIVLMDVLMPFLNGFEAAEEMAKAFPRVRVVLMSLDDCEVYVREAIRCGAAGFVGKAVIAAEVKLILQAVSSGETYFPRSRPPVNQ